MQSFCQSMVWQELQTRTNQVNIYSRLLLLLCNEIQLKTQLKYKLELIWLLNPITCFHNIDSLVLLVLLENFELFIIHELLFFILSNFGQTKWSKHTWSQSVNSNDPLIVCFKLAVIQACASQPCRNGAACNMSQTNPVEYVCFCDRGYSGKTCDSKFDGSINCNLLLYYSITLIKKPNSCKNQLIIRQFVGS